MSPLLTLLALMGLPLGGPGLVHAHRRAPCPGTPRALGDSHGSARFATDAERRALQAGDGLLIGRDGRTGRLLRYDGPAHLLTLAPTRSGKGVGTVIPNLLLAPRSVLVIDPKGENARVTHDGPHPLRPHPRPRPLRHHGSALGRLQPARPPLALKPRPGRGRRLPGRGPGRGDGRPRRHWGRPLERGGQGAPRPGSSSLPSATRTRTAAPSPPCASTSPSRPTSSAPSWGSCRDSAAAGGLVARAANRHLGKSDREASGVLSSAQRHTHFLDSPRIVASTARSDFAFASLRHEVASVFLVLPPNRLDAYSRWLRLLVSQALAEIARDAEAAGAPDDAPRLREPALFLLDEFAALGRLEAVERAMGLMAGYGLQLWPILQDMSQLRALYGARASTFVANAGVLQAFGVGDHDTARWLSQLMGQTTTAYETTSHRPGDSPSTSLHLTGRDLLTPDEVMRLPDHLQLLRVQGRPMIVATKLRYHADPEFDGLHAPQAR